MNTILLKDRKFWSQPYRVESPDYIYLITCKTIRAELWFVNNRKLRRRIDAFLAKYAEEYEVEIFAFELMGNHYHLLARFPNSNCAPFLRDFNARIAEAVRKLVPGFISGRLFDGPPTIQAIVDEEAVEKVFFYIWLQPVTSGLCSRISEYPGQSHVSDALNGIERDYSFFSYTDYHKAKIKNPSAPKEQYWKHCSFRYTRLPGHEHRSQKEYSALMFEKLEARRQKIIEELVQKKPNLRFLTKPELRKIKPGSRPYKTKKGGRRPLFIGKDSAAVNKFLKFYFGIVSLYKEACEKYRNGDFTVLFPPGTYRPSGMAIR